MISLARAREMTEKGMEDHRRAFEEIIEKTVNARIQKAANEGLTWVRVRADELKIQDHVCSLFFQMLKDKLPGFRVSKAIDRDARGGPEICWIIDWKSGVESDQ